MNYLGLGLKIADYHTTEKEWIYNDLPLVNIQNLLGSLKESEGIEITQCKMTRKKSVMNKKLNGLGK